MKRGFIGLILLIIIALILLKFFLNFDVFTAADSAHGRETLGYTGQLMKLVWSYIGAPVSFAWDRVVIPLSELWWVTFKSFIAWGQGNASTLGH